MQTLKQLMQILLRGRMLIIGIPLFIASSIGASLVAIDADDFQRELTRGEAGIVVMAMASFYWITAIVLFRAWRLWREYRLGGTAPTIGATR